MIKRIKKGYFTVIIDVYYNLNFFKKSVESIINQNYKKIELVIINNGANSEITKYINFIKKKNNFIKVLNYKKNIFSNDDPEQRFQICYNDALKISNCEYIYYQAYDDCISRDYLSRMSKLLKNENCVSASGMLLKINQYDEVTQNEKIGKFKNTRARFIHGGTITLDMWFNKHSFSYSSNILHFAFKRKALEKVGGFHRAIEQLVYLFILPQGMSGYDEKAFFYYREHPSQLNVITDNTGYIATKDIFSLTRKNKQLLEQIWSNYPESLLKKVIGRKSLYKNIDDHILKYTAKKIVISIYTLNFSGFYTILINNYRYNFYKYLIFYLFKMPIHSYYALRNKFKFISKNDQKLKNIYYYLFGYKR